MKEFGFTVENVVGAVMGDSQQMIRVAINGYGRIGRSVLRALYESKLQDQIKIVAINEPADIKTIAHLTRYDSTHGRWPILMCRDDSLSICGESNYIFHSDKLDQFHGKIWISTWYWNAVAALVIAHSAEKHLRAALNAFCFPSLLSLMLMPPLFMGLTINSLTGNEKIISSASCSTNCVIPVIQVFDDTSFRLKVA